MPPAVADTDSRAASSGVAVGVSSAAADADGRATSSGVTVGVSSTAVHDAQFAPIPYMVALDELRRDPAFDLTYLLPFRTTFDDSLRNARESIDAMRSKFRIAVFKIGTASNPRYRFFNNLYGYHLEHYSVMAVLCQQMPETCAKLETALIEHYLGSRGCQNILVKANAPKQCPCFVYVAMVELEHFRPKVADARKRGRITYH